MVPPLLFQPRSNKANHYRRKQKKKTHGDQMKPKLFHVRFVLVFFSLPICFVSFNSMCAPSKPMVIVTVILLNCINSNFGELGLQWRNINHSNDRKFISLMFHSGSVWFDFYFNCPGFSFIWPHFESVICVWAFPGRKSFCAWMFFFVASSVWFYSISIFMYLVDCYIYGMGWPLLACSIFGLNQIRKLFSIFRQWSHKMF